MKRYAFFVAIAALSFANFVKTNYAGAVIVKIDKERYGYEIELSTDFELKFDHQDNLLSIDD